MCKYRRILSASHQRFVCLSAHTCSTGKIPHILQLILKSIRAEAAFLPSRREFGEINALARLGNNQAAASGLEIFFYSRNASKGKRKTRKTAAENKQLDPPICSSQLSRFISIDSAAPLCLAHARSSIGVESCLGSIMLMSSSAERRASSGDITLVTSREANFKCVPTTD